MEWTLFTIYYIFQYSTLVWGQLCRLQGKQQSCTIDQLPVILPFPKWSHETPQKRLTEQTPGCHFRAPSQLSQSVTQCHLDSCSPAVTLIEVPAPFPLALIIE